MILTSEEIKIKYLLFNFPQLNSEVLQKEYWDNKLSFPQIKTKYGIDLKAISILLDYFNIPKRTISEAQNYIGQERIRKTCLKKYGTSNVLSKNAPGYKKKNQTVKNKYDVENVFQIKEVIDKIQNDSYYLEKYGLTLKGLRRKQSKEAWERLTDEQKYYWLYKSILRDDIVRKQSGYWSSSLETKFQEMLNFYNIKHETQFLLKDKSNYKIKRRFYDFKIKNTNILIEIQGQYWHADPRFYKKNDLILEYKNNKKTAQDIWKYDKIKKQFANNLGYNICYIWEKEIKEKSIDELRDFFIKILGELYDINKN